MHASPIRPARAQLRSKDQMGKVGGDEGRHVYMLQWCTSVFMMQYLYSSVV